MKKTLLITLTILIIILGFLFYDSRYDAVPLFSKQIDSRCPYYKDFLGRIYYKYEGSSLFIIFPPAELWLKVRNISQNNFRVIKVIETVSTDSSCIATDAQSVIYAGRVYKNADADTFESIGNGYYKDKTNVYFVSTIINGADASSFVLLSFPVGCNNPGPSYAKDKNFVYYAGNVIQGADSASFKLYCDNYELKIRDKNGTYSGGKLD